MRRKGWILAGLLVVILAGVVLWFALNLPSPLLVLDYGFPPTGGPTGNKMVLETVTFVELAPGYFLMGDDHQLQKGTLDSILEWLGLGTPPLPDSPPSNAPAHWVEIPRVIWVAETEITNAQYERFDRAHARPLDFGSDRDPVVDVSWDDASAYCTWLGECSGHQVRLPSESEWEFICRAGTVTLYSWGDSWDSKLAMAHIDGGLRSPARVKTYPPNPWGLFEMHGNVSEWCADTWQPDYRGAPSGGAAQLKPTRRDSTYFGLSYRVARGGSWVRPHRDSASASRGTARQGSTPDWIGFRPVLESGE